MSIQVTPIPRLTVLTVPAFSLGTTNAAGSADTAVASNSTLLAFDATLPDAITYGQSGAVGSATVTSRRDHAHAMAASDSTDAASQAEQVGGSSATVYVSPARQQFHASALKGWVSWSQSGTHAITASYNWTSVTDAGVGDTNHVFATDFDSADWSCSNMAEQDSTIGIDGGTKVAGSVSTLTRNLASTDVDIVDNQMAIFGQQV